MYGTYRERSKTLFSANHAKQNGHQLTSLYAKKPKELQLWGLQKIVGGQHLVQKASDNILGELRYRAIDGKRGKMVEREHLLFFQKKLLTI